MLQMMKFFWIWIGAHDLGSEVVWVCSI